MVTLLGTPAKVDLVDSNIPNGRRKLDHENEALQPNSKKSKFDMTSVNLIEPIRTEGPLNLSKSNPTTDLIAAAAATPTSDQLHILKLLQMQHLLQNQTISNASSQSATNAAPYSISPDEMLRMFSPQNVNNFNQQVELQRLYQSSNLFNSNSMQDNKDQLVDFASKVSKMSPTGSSVRKTLSKPKTVRPFMH